MLQKPHSLVRLTRRSTPPTELPTHEGQEWMYILSGRLRLVLGERDFIIKPGEAVEFSTWTPHWFGAVDGPVEDPAVELGAGWQLAEDQQVGEGGADGAVGAALPGGAVLQDEDGGVGGEGGHASVPVGVVEVEAGRIAAIAAASARAEPSCGRR